MLSVRLPEGMEAQLEELARRTGQSKSYYARRAIGEWLDAHGNPPASAKLQRSRPKSGASAKTAKASQKARG